MKKGFEVGIFSTVSPFFLVARNRTYTFPTLRTILLLWPSNPSRSSLPSSFLHSDTPPPLGVYEYQLLAGLWYSPTWNLRRKMRIHT
jgi:hypothetical protein